VHVLDKSHDLDPVSGEKIGTTLSDQGFDTADNLQLVAAWYPDPSIEQKMRPLPNAGITAEEKGQRSPMICIVAFG